MVESRTFASHIASQIQTPLLHQPRNRQAVMAYITATGQVVEKKPWSLSSIPDFFISIFYAILLFFQTLISPGSSRKGSSYKYDYRAPSSNQGPPKPPRRRMGGLGFSGNSPCAPPAAGGG